MANAASDIFRPLAAGALAPARRHPWPAPSSRVVRGGSWNNNSRNARSAYRNHNDPANRNNNIGFRLASTLAAGVAAFMDAASAHELRPEPVMKSGRRRPCGAVARRRRLAGPRARTAAPPA
jgi:hypothetical protein